MTLQDPSRFLEPSRTTTNEIQFRVSLEDYISNSLGSNVEKLQNFTKYVPTQDLRKFLCRYELFRKILHVHGSIVECGVLYGGGLMAWAQLSEIFEPLNHLRNIIGFDIYEPTVVALKHLVNRIPKGGIIAFDELNHEVWPGETIAVMQEIGINNLRVERLPFGSTMS